MDQLGEGHAISATAKVVLAAAGLSVTILIGLLGLAVFKCLRRATQLLTPQASKGKKTSSKAKHQAQQQQEQQQRQQQVLAAHAEPLERRNLKENLKELNKEAEKSKKAVAKGDHASGHALFLNTLKGHGDAVHSVVWSPDGMQLATACEDMVVRIYDTVDVTARSQKIKSIKVPKIPQGAGFGDGADEVVVLMRGTNMALLAAYGPSANKAETGPFEQKWLLEKVHDKEAPLSMCTVPSAAAHAQKGIAISCSTKKDARVFNMQGKQLAVLDPNSLLNHSLVASKDGRFAAVASFTSEVRLWELKWDTRDTGAFRGAFKAMELKGHKSQVMCAAISADNKRAVTASKDGTLRVWNINVRYELEEDPKTTLVIAMPLPQGKVYQHIDFGPDNVLAASHEGMVHLLSADKGELLESIDAHDSTITSMAWCPRKVKSPGSAAPHAVLATSSLDKRVRLWRWPL